jgi:hypothetical protein
MSFHVYLNIDSMNGLLPAVSCTITPKNPKRRVERLKAPLDFFKDVFSGNMRT